MEKFFSQHEKLRLASLVLLCLRYFTQKRPEQNLALLAGRRFETFPACSILVPYQMNHHCYMLGYIISSILYFPISIPYRLQNISSLIHGSSTHWIKTVWKI